MTTMSDVFDGAMRRIRVVEALIQARLEVDVAGLVAGVQARLEARLKLERVSVDADLADKRGPLGWGRVRTSVWRAPRWRKIVLSHVKVPPIIEGFAVVLLPEERLAAPAFGADLMALPTRLSVNADVYGGPPETLREAMAPLGESFVRLHSGTGPAWAATISSGIGLHAKVSPRMVDDAFGALTAALSRAIDVGEAAPNGDGEPAQRAFFAQFHGRGPRRGPLGRVFGAPWAERYSRLLFE
jgi:hypothetical protein